MKKLTDIEQRDDANELRKVGLLSRVVVRLVAGPVLFLIERRLVRQAALGWLQEAQAAHLLGVFRRTFHGKVDA